MSLADFEKFLTSFESIWNIKQHLHGYHLSRIHYQVLSLSCIPRRWQAYPRFCYTAISIYVVGSKLQGYGTRPKGGMGRLELILRFRGCRREMDMEAENTSEIFAVWTRHC